MHSVPVFLLSFASLFAHSDAGFPIPVRPNVADVPSIPKPVVPKPVVPIPPPRIVDPYIPGSAQQPEVVAQGNLQRLEDRLEIVGTGIDFGSQLVDAILGKGDATPTPTPMSGNASGAQSMFCDLTLFSSPTSTNICYVVTPTATLPQLSVHSCSSYASILSRCAAATTSFYDLAKSDQAACACHSTTRSYRPLCTVVVQKQDDSYDGYEKACYDMFNEFNYSSIRDAMENVAVLPGKGLCAAMSSQGASGTVSRLAPVFATTTEGSCAESTLSTFVTSGANVWKGSSGAVSVVMGFALAWELLA